MCNTLYNAIFFVSSWACMFFFLIFLGRFNRSFRICWLDSGYGSRKCGPVATRCSDGKLPTVRCRTLSALHFYSIRIRDQGHHLTHRCSLSYTVVVACPCSKECAHKLLVLAFVAIRNNWLVFVA